MKTKELVKTEAGIALRQAEEILKGAAPKPEVGPKQCVWVERGLVAFRICTHGHECERCEFGQAVQEAGW